MAVREVIIADHWDEVQALLKMNWEETGFDFEFAPSRERYCMLQEMEMMIALAAFDGDRIVGYSTAVVVPHQFNPSLKFCASDALFVLPEYRNGLIPGRLIVATEHAAMRLGANFISWHTRAGTTLADTMTNHGYQPVDTIVMKGFH